MHFKDKYRHLKPEDGDEEFETIRYMAIDSTDSEDFIIKRNHWLSIEERSNIVTPETEIGSILRDEYPDELILLLKVCIDGRTLGWEYLPPGSKRFEVNGTIYAGYRDSPDTWASDSTPKPTDRYGGRQYDIDINNIKKVLYDIETFYPGAKGYGHELAGFFFWNGESDSKNDVYSNRYEENLANFIKNVRRDLDAAKDAPFVLATVGLNAQYAINTKKIRKAQIQVEEFFDNVRTVDTHDVFGEELNYDMISRQDELIINMEVGSSMGWAMVELLKKN
jgi:hypothetical protein